jgi:hypothetical protein
MRISRKLFPIGIMIDQNQPENVKYFRYIGSIITNDARFTHEIKPRIAVTKEPTNKKYALSPENWTYS